MGQVEDREVWMESDPTGEGVGSTTQSGQKPISRGELRLSKTQIRPNKKAYHMKN